MPRGPLGSALRRGWLVGVRVGVTVALSMAAILSASASTSASVLESASASRDAGTPHDRVDHVSRTVVRAMDRLSGPTIQIDPGFAYYQDRSSESIADELVQNGYVGVRYFITNENDVDGKLVEALKRKGPTVWALVLGNGSYSVDRFPEGWEDWQMELVTPVNDGYYRFSPHSAEYVEWKKQALATLVSTYPFDGIEIAEPYLPDWNGIDRGYYGDVGPHARAAFLEQYGREIPNFTDPSHPHYYRTDTELYRLWVDFRVDAVNAFLDEIVNGEGGVRDANPDVLVATWSLAIDAGPNSVELERECQGLDAAEMITAVEPDLHILQTNWPDWLRPDLPADYVRTYQSFVDDIRAHHPDIPLGIQTDIGSQLAMARDRAWMDEFIETVDAMGFVTWTAYEYHIGGYMYDEPPVPTQAARTSDGAVRVSFTRRIDPDSAIRPASFQVVVDGKRRQWVNPRYVSVDGNMVEIRQPGLPSKGFELAVFNVTDDPERWLYNKTAEPHSVPLGASVHVPAAR